MKRKPQPTTKQRETGNRKVLETAARELTATFDRIQQKHHPFSEGGTRGAFEFPLALEDDEWEEP